MFPTPAREGKGWKPFGRCTCEHTCVTFDRFGGVDGERDAFQAVEEKCRETARADWTAALHEIDGSSWLVVHVERDLGGACVAQAAQNNA